MERPSALGYEPQAQTEVPPLHWHSDLEANGDVPPTGLAASTRAYAKIIADVNKLNLKDLVRP